MVLAYMVFHEFNIVCMEMVRLFVLIQLNIVRFLLGLLLILTTCGCPFFDTFLRYRFYYPPSAIEWEVSMVFLLSLIDASRRALTSRGNKTEQLKPLAWSIGLAVPVVVGYAFFLDLQTYV